MTGTAGTARVSTTTLSTGWSPQVGFGCFILFLLPFAGFGLFAAVQTLHRLATGNWREALFFGLFATVFGGVGFAGIGLALAGRRRQKEQDLRKARHPAEPWLWQDDWASGRIPDSSRTTVWMSWAFATMWNAISFPAGYLGTRSALEQGNTPGYIGLLFPVAGMGLLAWAIRNTLRLQKYGVSHLELATIPGVIAHTLTGHIRVTRVLQATEDFQVSLTCVRRVTTRSGKNNSTSETILWQEEKSVRGEPSRDVNGMGTRISIAFRLPPEVRPSDGSDPNDRIVWRVEAAASVPGVDYASRFEVPVFRTAASDRPLTQEEEQATPEPSMAGYQPPADSRISVVTNRRGTEMVFPAARNVGAGVGGTAFTLVWLGITWALVHFKAPVVFPIVFGGFALLLIFGMLQIWLGVSKVTVDSGTVTVATGYLFPSRERKFSAADLSGVSTTIGMQAGSTVYYDVVLYRKDGKKVVAGRAIRRKREAEWLALTLRNALGLNRSERSNLTVHSRLLQSG